MVSTNVGRVPVGRVSQPVSAPRRRHNFTVLLLLLTTIHAPGPASAQPAKKPLAIEDLYLFDAPRSVVLAPDGKSILFIRTWIDAKSKQERHSLWIAEGSRDKAHALEQGEPDARHAVFSPDGKWIAFLSTRPHPRSGKQPPPAPPYSDAATDVWLISTKGGPAFPLGGGGGKSAHGRVFNDGFYGRVAFSPDGTRLAFVADDGKDPRTPEEITNNVIVVRGDQGEGYTGYGPAQVWVASIGREPAEFQASIERLTNDDIWYGDPQWSPDGKTLVVHANKTNDRESVRFSINKNYDLFAIDLATKKQRQLTTGPGPEVSPRFSPDGSKVMCLSVPRKGSHRDCFNLLLITLSEGGEQSTLLFDHHGPDADKPSHPAPSFPLPESCWRGNECLTYTSEQGTATKTILLHVPSGRSGVVPSSDPKAAKLHKSEFPEVTPCLLLMEHSLAKDKAFFQQAMTPPGNLFLRERLLAEDKVIEWNSDGGQKIDGVLTLPPEGTAAKPPYKVILYPHGGPHSRSTASFNLLTQVFAAQGYAVFQPNFRGSSGYGQKFIDADRFDLGGGDMRDILSGLDYLIRERIVDPKHQYVFGSSYGGFMTTWLVGQTTRFRAAVAQNAVTDMNIMWGLTDIQSWTQWELGGYPWEVPGAMRERSPLTHVAKVKTPTLILHARDDRRVPLPLGQAYYQALKARGVPTQMVIYPDEGHGIRQPRHREDLMRRVLDWFTKHS